jgi:hypothetical protein
MHPNVKSLIGKTFGRLLVVGTAPRPEGSKGRGQHWECVCTCLEMLVVRSDSLMQGKSTSCGCTNAVTTAMRANIKRIRTKPTVSVHPSQDCTKTNPKVDLDMDESKSTSSDTVGVKIEELQGMYNTLTNMRLGDTTGAVMAVKAALVRIMSNAVVDSLTPRASITPEQTLENAARMGLEPRTVKGEILREQAQRIASEPTHFTGLNFKPVLNNLSDRKHSHYFKKCPYDAVDIYRILELFSVTDQKLGHAIKKLLVAGGRGAGKDILQDIQEAIDTLERWKEMREEDITACKVMLDLMKV